MAWRASVALQGSSGCEAAEAIGLMNVVFKLDSVLCGGG